MRKPLHKMYKSMLCAEVFLKAYIEERVLETAEYIIENKATVRLCAKQFGISKSTVHMVVTKQNG
jgi:putative DeoR family transcriptional regulator (stage III sporulation protein D)